eukprot:g18791.t1
MKMLCQALLLVVTATAAPAAPVAASLSPRAQLLQLLKQAPDASPATLAEVAGALGSLALEADRSQDDGATITAIRTMITSLTTAIQEQHTTAQTALQNQSNFDTCVKAKDIALSEAAKMATTTTTLPTTTTSGAPTTTVTTTMHADLITCKAEDERQEASLLKRNSTCHGELTASHSAKMATCALYDDMNYASAGAARVARCADSTLFSGSYEDFLERDIQILATLKLRGQNCGPYVARVAACSNYEACYISEVAMQESSYKAAATLSTSRKAEMTALQRILCLLDVLGLPVAQQSSKLQECLVATHNVSTLDMPAPVAPAKAACDPGAITMLRNYLYRKEASILKSWFKHFDTNMNGIIEKSEFIERALATTCRLWMSFTSISRMSYPGNPVEFWNELELADAETISLREISEELAVLWGRFRKFCGVTFLGPKDLLVRIADRKDDDERRKSATLVRLAVGANGTSPLMGPLVVDATQWCEGLRRCGWTAGHEEILFEALDRYDEALLVSFDF